MQICIYQPAVALKVNYTVIKEEDWLLKLPLCVTSSQFAYRLYNLRLCSQPTHLLSCRRYNIKVVVVLCCRMLSACAYFTWSCCSFIRAAIFPCWREWAEENLPGEES